MSVSENKIYQDLHTKVSNQNLSSEKTVELFREIVSYYLNNDLDVNEFSGLSSGLYFYKDNSVEVNKKYPIIFWLMSVAAESYWDEKYSKEKIQLYYESPEDFEKWWRENINSPVKQSFSRKKGFRNRL